MTKLEVGKTYHDCFDDKIRPGNLFIVLAILYTDQGNWVVSRHPSFNYVKGGRQMPMVGPLEILEIGWSLSPEEFQHKEVFVS